jgi:hypothetical protein
MCSSYIQGEKKQKQTMYFIKYSISYAILTEVNYNIQ